MDASRRRRRDFIQNIAIVLLSLSAVALFTQTQLYNLGRPEDGSYFGQTSASASGVQSPQGLTDLAAPVRVAVTSSHTYGRYGALCLTTDNEAFFPLLSEALASASAFTPCETGDFLAALNESSVYYDFLSPLPLSILAGLTGVTLEDSGLSVRRLLLAGTGDQAVQLWLWDGGEACFRSSTAVSPARLEEIIGSYEVGNAFFAVDDLESDEHYASLSPCSLFFTELPELPDLNASNPLTDDDRLLSALDFNPHTNYRHQESDGTQIIAEGVRSLRIRSDGTVLYQSGSDPTLDIEAARENEPTAEEAVLGADALLSRLLSDVSSDARLYLLGCRQENGVTELRFGYQVDGLPIRFSDGSCAAEVTLTGTAVTRLSLRFRQYTAADSSAPLLPLRQALAIAAGSAGAEMAIGYADTGSDTVSAAWLLESN